MCAVAYFNDTGLLAALRDMLPSADRLSLVDVAVIDDAAARVMQLYLQYGWIVGEAVASVRATVAL